MRKHTWLQARTRPSAWGVAPIHGRKLQIGIAAPAAVVQPQDSQRHAPTPTCPSEGRSHVHPPPMSDGHSRIGTGALQIGAQGPPA